jgi:3'5'-cyclic nucleotide phosphodiesterase
MQPISSELGFLLEGLAEWSFDIFAVKACTKSCLRVVTMTCMTELNLLDYTDFDGVKLESYLTEIDKAYHDNPYHNSIHAADVVQTTYHFCTKGRLIDASGLTPLATFALLFAGAIHDVNHGGLTNHFLVATSASLAIQYNDHSPLENMHVATAFNIMHTPAFNFMEQLPASTKKEIRRLVIAIVLATDNDQHFSLHEGLESIANCREPSMSPISQLISRTKRLSSGTPNSAMTSNITPICCSPEDKDSNGKLGSMSRPQGVRLNLRSRYVTFV